jgi:DNA/RNA-binding domain of Phe-tRNA-synthetase-like protein
LRRAQDGLPRVNRLADVYNAISVLHQIPVGGEDLSGCTTLDPSRSQVQGVRFMFVLLVVG